MKVLVTGASGQLGFDLCRELTRRQIEHKGVCTADFDICCAQSASNYLGKYMPDVVVHCAAWTAVDLAEEESIRAYEVNAKGTEHVARACRQIKAKMVYISSDYVFNGQGDAFYQTGDPTDPVSIYGKSKLAGETAVKELLEEYFIVRVSWVYGIHGNNFVHTMLTLAETHAQLRVVNDQFGSPSYTMDLASLICDMINTDRYGIYHASNEGICSWSEFAQEIFYQSGRSVTVIPISAQEYGSRAPRPFNSRLDKSCLDAAGFYRLPHWKDALKRYLEEITAKGYTLGHP